MTEQPESQPTLPGLELEPENGAAPSALRSAVVVTINALQADGLLENRHAAMCQLALELADSVTAGRRSGRASAAAMAAAQLRETLLALPEPTASGVAEKFDAYLASLMHEDEPQK
jgi:hypothetical protein